MSDSPVPGTASVSRRRFLQAVGAAGVAAAGGPVILHAANKSGSKRPVVGTGAHTFEVYHDWGELPAAIRTGIRTGFARTPRVRSTSITRSTPRASATIPWSCSIVKGGS